MNPVKCPKCGKINDGHLDFCIYCGAIFEEAKPENDEIVIDLRNLGRNKDSYSPYDSISYPNDKRRSDDRDSAFEKPKTLYRYLVIIGYITAILGGVLGFIISIFLITRKDPYAKRHGFIQLSILICWVMLIGALVLTGQMDLNVLLNPMNTTNTTRESDSECKCKFNQPIWIVNYLFFNLNFLKIFDFSIFLLF